MPLGIPAPYWLDLLSYDPVAVAGRCFEWVRDEIRRSGDFRLDPVTCSASQVLRHGTGFCYAKSHLPPCPRA